MWGRGRERERLRLRERHSDYTPLGFAEKEQGLKGPVIPAPPRVSLPVHGITEWLSWKPLGFFKWPEIGGANLKALLRGGAGCSQALVQGGSQSFPTVRYRGGSPRDDPCWFKEPGLSRHGPGAPTILPLYSNAFLSFDLYTA